MKPYVATNRLPFFCKDLKMNEYNNSASAWYDGALEQIGDVSESDKAALIESLEMLDGDALSAMVVDEETLNHPKLELYQLFTKKREGDVLIVVKETYFDKQSRVKRSIVGQWEAPPAEHQLLQDSIS